MKPAHKDTDHPPGQIKYEQKLSDYIDRVAKEDGVKKEVSQKRKLTIEEWWRTQQENQTALWWNIKLEEASAIWKAAQENK
jgi:hypothetical protein